MLYCSILLYSISILNKMTVPHIYIIILKYLFQLFLEIAWIAF